MAKHTKNRKDLSDLCDYIFEHEFEDYCETLQETLPDAEAGKINDLIQAGDFPALEAYAFKTGAKEKPQRDDLCVPCGSHIHTLKCPRAFVNSPPGLRIQSLL